MHQTFFKKKHRNSNGQKSQDHVRRRPVGAKARLDKAFSLYIRLRDSIRGYCFCITCGKPFYFKEGDCGHFISRNKIATRWHERNCNAQCKMCNIMLSGLQYQHGLAIDRKWGVGTAEALLAMSRQVCKVSEYEMNVLADEYEKKVAVLIKEKL